MMYQTRLRIIAILKYLSLMIGVLFAIIPLVVVVFSSFKTTEEFSRTGPLTLPENILNFENYARAFIEGDMLLAFGNTFIILLVSLTGSIVMGTMVAYILSRFDFRGKTWILMAFMVATLIPGVTTQVATFRVVAALGLMNTRLALIILYMGTDIISVYVFLQFLESISVSLDESAMLDGASYFTIYRRIIFPLLKPAIVTVAIIKGVANYNDFYRPFLYAPKPELAVISTSLFKFKGPYGDQWEVLTAAIIIAIIPTLLLFILAQKYIYNGLTQGSVKS